MRPASAKVALAVRSAAECRRERVERRRRPTGRVGRPPRPGRRRRRSLRRAARSGRTARGSRGVGERGATSAVCTGLLSPSVRRTTTRCGRAGRRIRLRGSAAARRTSSRAPRSPGVAGSRLRRRRAPPGRTPHGRAPGRDRAARGRSAPATPGGDRRHRPRSCSAAATARSSRVGEWSLADAAIERESSSTKSACASRRTRTWWSRVSAGWAAVNVSKRDEGGHECQAGACPARLRVRQLQRSPDRVGAASPGHGGGDRDDDRRCRRPPHAA